MEIDDYILEKAIKAWGVESQIEMIIEECSELILALQKYKRSAGVDFENKKEVEKAKKVYINACEEIADVRIMIEQAIKMFDKETIQFFIYNKISRLDKRINDCNFNREMNNLKINK